MVWERERCVHRPYCPSKLSSTSRLHLSLLSPSLSPILHRSIKQLAKAKQHVLTRYSSMVEPWPAASPLSSGSATMELELPGFPLNPSSAWVLPKVGGSSSTSAPQCTCIARTLGSSQAWRTSTSGSRTSSCPDTPSTAAAGTFGYDAPPYLLPMQRRPRHHQRR